jgi:diguanylate cyclase (GGDEF)-like protein
MMEKWLDYYKILQVHSLAEQEVIESAYKRLCKKYHPDINKGQNSEEKIKLLNMAYYVLKDPKQRKEFHTTWTEKNTFHISHSELEYRRYESENIIKLENYFHYISQEDYTSAYQMISEYDKCRISIQDFIKWQSAVSKVFKILKYECLVLKQFKNVMLGDSEFNEVIECSVKITEKNLRNKTTMHDEVAKYLVREGKFWSVYVGYSHLQPLIDKFENLAESKLFPTAMEYWTYMQIRTDHISGLPNKEGFLDKAKVEISRNKRYGNALTIIFLKLKLNDYYNGLSKKDYEEIVQRMYAGSIQKKIRDTDLIGAWDKCEFVIIMPDTKFEAGLEAVRKLCMLDYYKDIPKEYKATIYAGISRFDRKPLLEVISEARLRAMLGYKTNKTNIRFCNLRRKYL